MRLPKKIWVICGLMVFALEVAAFAGLKFFSPFDSEKMFATCMMFLYPGILLDAFLGTKTGEWNFGFGLFLLDGSIISIGAWVFWMIPVLLIVKLGLWLKNRNSKHI